MILNCSALQSCGFERQATGSRQGEKRDKVQGHTSSRTTSKMIAVVPYASPRPSVSPCRTESKAAFFYCFLVSSFFVSFDVHLSIGLVVIPRLLRDASNTGHM